MKQYVIKLGGSLVSKSDDKLVDFDFLSKFRDVMRGVAQDAQVFVVLGGGYLMRKYRDMAEQAGIDEDLQLHWIGTTCNVLNAEVVRAYMSEICNERIVAYEQYYDKSEIKFEPGKHVIVGGGGRAGHSGDVDALVVAKKLGIETIISLKDIDGVYSADPDTNPDAKFMDTLNWDEYMEIIGNPEKHEPGANYPIDPVASRMAKESGKSFVVIGGRDLDNFEKVVKGEEFHGSIIS